MLAFVSWLRLKMCVTVKGNGGCREAESDQDDSRSDK